MAYSPEDIFAAASSIKPHLVELLNSEAAAEMDKKLSELLAQFPQDTDNISQQILTLLTSQENTRKWSKDFLKTPPTERAYQPTLSPYPSSISGLIEYKCPQCNYSWYQRQTGQPIPNCPDDNIPLKKVQP